MQPDAIVRFCPRCRRETTWYKGGYPNHVVHAILSLMTFGLWLVVWLCIAISAGYECGKCNAGTGSSVAAAVKIILLILLALIILSVLISILSPARTRY